MKSRPVESVQPSMIRALIVDDEPLARDCIRLALEATDDLRVVGECQDGESAVRAIERLRPDLVFLDVQMPGVDGFDVIERVGAEAMPPVIFVTAYDRHAVRAFQCHALDYILKPFDDERFHEAVRHARARLGAERRGDFAERLAALVERHAGGGQAPIRRLMVRDGDRIHYVSVDAVDFMEADGNYVRLHVGARSHLVRTTLSHLDGRLDPAHFMRIHRSTIVNLDRIAEVQPWAGGDYVAILRDGRRLKVSRTYREALLQPTL